MRRFGWLPEVQAAPPLESARLGLSIAPSESHELVTVASDLGILEQGQTPSCVSQALAAAARLRARVEGHGCMPSRRWLHLHCRRRDHRTTGDVPDVGTWISTACAVTREVGYPDEPHWAWDDARALDEDDARRCAWADESPGVEVRHHAHDQRSAVQEHGILTDEQTRAAIAAGYPVVFGAYVDEAYQRLDRWEPVAFDGPVAGGHAQVALGYGLDGVTVLNSWGSGWGTGGLALLSWRCWATQCRDKRAIELVRRTTS